MERNGTRPAAVSLLILGGLAVTAVSAWAQGKPPAVTPLEAFSSTLTSGLLAMTATLSTMPPTEVTEGTAKFNGSVNPDGLETNAWFEWGTDPTLAVATSTPPQPVGSGLSAVLVTAQVSGLKPGTMYYVRVVASDSLGTTTKGDTVSLRTRPKKQVYITKSILHESPPYGHIAGLHLLAGCRPRGPPGKTM